MKPSGVFLLLGKWPQALFSRRYTAFLSALGGLAFATIENLVYLNIYFPEHSQSLVLWRWFVTLPLHVSLSFIVGFGINQRLVASVKGQIPFLQGNRVFFAIPIVLHGMYNLFAYLLETRWHWWEF